MLSIALAVCAASASLAAAASSRRGADKGFMCSYREKDCPYTEEDYDLTECTEFVPGACTEGPASFFGGFWFKATVDESNKVSYSYFRDDACTDGDLADADNGFRKTFMVGQCAGPLYEYDMNSRWAVFSFSDVPSPKATYVAPTTTAAPQPTTVSDAKTAQVCPFINSDCTKVPPIMGECQTFPFDTCAKPIDLAPWYAHLSYNSGTVTFKRFADEVCTAEQSQWTRTSAPGECLGPVEEIMGFKIYMKVTSQTAEETTTLPVPTTTTEEPTVEPTTTTTVVETTTTVVETTTTLVEATTTPVPAVTTTTTQKTTVATTTIIPEVDPTATYTDIIELPTTTTTTTSIVAATTTKDGAWEPAEKDGKSAAAGSIPALASALLAAATAFFMC